MAVGSLTRPKGMDRLIAAFPKLCSLLPSATLTILGEGPERGLLEQQIRDLGMELRIRLPGFSADVRGQLAECDLFVLPSQLEACPTVALEALATGTPVVSTDNPGGKELGEIFGYDVAVVPRENPLALARAIVAVLDQKRRVRESTRRILEQEFRPPAVDRQYREIYASVLSAARAS